MATNSNIEWTEMTWNPVTGCVKVSQGCKNCYAERMALRLRAMGSARYADGFAPTLHYDLLDVPTRWKKSRVIFVNSMSDLFQETVPLAFIQEVFETMSSCQQHVFQILTKRADRLAEVSHKLPWPENVWMGVSVESTRVLNRIAHLQRTPAHIKFLSCEPLLGPLENIPLQGIDWAIVGGESGPRARPMKKEWVTSILRQCRRAGTHFFFKQWGGPRKDLTGRQLNGRVYNEMPQRIVNDARKAA